MCPYEFPSCGRSSAWYPLKYGLASPSPSRVKSIPPTLCGGRSVLALIVLSETLEAGVPDRMVTLYQCLFSKNDPDRNNRQRSERELLKVEILNCLNGFGVIPQSVLQSNRGDVVELVE